MKKIFIAIVLALACFTAKAQKDSTVISASAVKMEVESYINKKGEEKAQYWAVYKGEVYASNKSTYERANAYRRFGYQPLFILITDKKSKAQRIIAL